MKKYVFNISAYISLYMCLFNDAFNTLNAQIFSRLRILRGDFLVNFRMKMFLDISSYIHIPTTVLLIDKVINNVW